jgi:type VI secretion system secreted protein Hcp
MSGTKIHGALHIKKMKTGFESIHFGAMQQVTTDIGNSARTSGRPVIKDVTIERPLKADGLDLLFDCIQTNTFDATIVLPTAANEGVAGQIKIDLKDAMISKYEIVPGESGDLRERFEINFTQFTQRTQNLADGNFVDIAKPITWDITRNRIMS